MSSQEIIEHIQTTFEVVEVIDAGPKGEKGEPGETGANFTFSSPATSWTINHNLGYRPIVTLLSIGGLDIEGQIVHTSLNQVVASFVIATAGSARVV